eukprot:TRINITY_DN2645_c0_g1_i2.p1 TRINITY_DN2645_c0_g1~~TRINITY_DN2645_c0_g1_i2.p1  ORF type:complete len:135 (+),score=28.60 TRINITY_DN2645_c0_g1_i2:85-489(+)
MHASSAQKEARKSMAMIVSSICTANKDWAAYHDRSDILDGSIPITVQFSLRCPAPAPRESGALPSAAVPERGGVTVPCPLAALAHVDDPFSVTSDPLGVITYEHETQSCLISTAALPSPAPEDGTTVVVTVEAP